MEKGDPDSLRTPTTDPYGTGSLLGRAIGIIAFATVLALLYFGRHVLIPFAVALLVSLLIAPLVRRLRRFGLGRVPSVLVAVFMSAFVVTAAAGVLGTQVLRMAASLLVIAVLGTLVTQSLVATARVVMAAAAALSLAAAAAAAVTISSKGQAASN